MTDNPNSEPGIPVDRNGIPLNNNDSGSSTSEATDSNPNSITIAAEAVAQVPAANKIVDYIGLFKSVIEKHSNDKKWALGRFVGIKTLSNTKVGTVGQDFIEAMCVTLGIPILFPLNKLNKRLNQSPWDLKLHEITFELKTATEDTTGKFQFNHIRYHRAYDAVLCLGVSPDELLFNIYSKADIVTGKAGKLVSMEKGANASYKLTKSKRELYHLNSFEVRLKEFAGSFIR
jgi:hypothetical protein